MLLQVEPKVIRIFFKVRQPIINFGFYSNILWNISYHSNLKNVDLVKHSLFSLLLLQNLTVS